MFLPATTRTMRALLRCSAFANVCLATGLVVAAPALAAAQASGIAGRVEESGSGRPVSDVLVAVTGTTLQTFTDVAGAFRIDSVPSGQQTIRLTHVGFGERTVPIDVAAGSVVTVRLTVSASAVELEPIAVESLSRSERAARGAGYRRNVVARSQLAALETTSATVAEALRQFIPSVRSRSVNLVGASVCIELRTVRATFRNDCLSPAVYLDGVPVTNPTTLYNTLDVSVVESLEVVPAAEAGARFGTGALFGALLIETRRPGAGLEDRPSLVRRSPGFDWSQEPQGHATRRSFLYGLVGNAVGLAIGVTAANECIGTRPPSNDRIIAKCEGGTTFASATAAFVLPAFGGALGSRVGGATAGSQGRLLPAVVGGVLALVPAYGLLFSARRLDSGLLRGLGVGVIVLGVPAATTLADHQFRNRR